MLNLLHFFKYINTYVSYILFFINFTYQIRKSSFAVYSLRRQNWKDMFKSQLERQWFWLQPLYFYCNLIIA